MLRQNMRKLSLIVIFVIFSQIVLGIGITPGRHTTNFAPNAYEKVNFKIINNENKEMQVALHVEGELKDYVKLHDGIIDLKASNKEYETFYEVKLPDKIEKPGNHEIRITAIEVSKNYKEGESAVFVTTAVVSQLFIRVPYPDKYIEVGEISVLDAEVDRATKFIIPVINLGQKDISKLDAIIDILGPTGQKITSISTDSKKINSMDKTELVAQWKAEVNPGKYKAVVNFNYDNNYLKKEKSFEIGNLLIEIIDVFVKDFKLGSVAKFNILVENKWSEKISDVYAGMKIIDKSNNLVGDSKSSNENIEALGKEELNTFWDTEGIKEGNYDADLTLYYTGKTSSRRLNTQVTSNAITVDMLGTGKVIAVQSETNKNLLLGILVVILIIINVGWFVYIKRRNKNAQN